MASLGIGSCRRWAGEDRGREGGGEAEDLPSPFEDLFVHDLELGWCWGDDWLVYVSRGMRALRRT